MSAVTAHGARRSVDRRPLPRWLSIGLLLGALALAVGGGRLLLAGIAAWQAESFVRDWNQSGEAPSPRAWDTARAAADRAIRLYPGSNGDYLDRLGRIQEWRHFDLPFGHPDAESSRRAALAAYRQAVQARPDWPYSWTQLAYVKLRLGEFDSEFDEALERGFENGPWRLHVNRQLAEISLLGWPQLSPLQRQRGLESMRRATALSAGAGRQLHDLAQRLDRTAPFCAALPAELKATRRLCRG